MKSINEEGLKRIEKGLNKSIADSMRQMLSEDLTDHATCVDVVMCFTDDDDLEGDFIPELVVRLRRRK